MDRRRILAHGMLALVALAAFPVAMLAGPPLLCHPFYIGGAKSLPWGNGSWSASDNSYDLTRLVGDTLGLLTPETPVIVRMETLRRATIYAQRDPAIARDLLTRLKERAMGATSRGRLDPLELFDLGYFVETYKQANWAFTKSSPNGQGWNRVEKPNPAEGFDGYAWVLRAISLRGNDAEMEFAAALIQVDKREESRLHLQKAVAGATEGSLLARNLVLHFGDQGTTLAALRAKVGKS